MEPRNSASPASPAPKSDAPKTAPKGATSPPKTSPAKTAPKGATKGATKTTPKAPTAPKLSAAKRRELVATISNAKASAKTKTSARRALREAGYAPDGKSLAAAPKGAAPKGSSGTRAKGPSPERAKLAKTVAGLRAKGAKWNEIAAETGKSEPTLAKLRTDVRAGVFAKISPVASRVPSDAF